MTAPAEATWQRLLQNQPTGFLENDMAGWQEVWRFLNGARDFEVALAEAYT
jgi:hypothetical protein